MFAPRRGKGVAGCWNLVAPHQASVAAWSEVLRSGKCTRPSVCLSTPGQLQGPGQRD